MIGVMATFTVATLPIRVNASLVADDMIALLALDLYNDHL